MNEIRPTSISNPPILYSGNKEIKIDPLIKSISFKVFSNLPPYSESLFPFITIKYLATTDWELFAKSAMEALQEKGYSQRSDHLTTSSLVTSYALSVIFLGVKQTKQMIERLQRQTKVRIDITLPTGQIWAYQVSNLFEGSINFHINQDPSFELLSEEKQNERIGIYLNNIIQNFFEYTQTFIDQAFQEKSEEEVISKLDESFKNINYNFNLPTIDLIIKEINKNNSKVNLHDQSFIYCLAELIEGEANQPSFKQLFILEQYMCPVTRESRFRIYESYFTQTTLLQEMIRRQYGNQGENSWSLDKVIRFLNKFKEKYTKKVSPSQSSPITFKDKVLTGLSLRYFSAPFSPTKCMDHLAEVAHLNPKLKGSFLKKDRITYLMDFIRLNIVPDQLNESESLIPFKIIFKMASFCLKPFIKEIMEKIYRIKYDNSDLQLETSCVNTIYLVCSIFLGVHKCKKELFKLTKNLKIEVEVNLYPKNHYSYAICGLFNGALLLQTNQNPSFEFLNKVERNKNITTYLDSLSSDFFKYTDPLINRASQVEDKEKSIEQLEQEFKKIDYQFNHFPIEALKKEIEAHNEKINSKTSFVYCIGIMSSKHEQFEHIFLVEQFFEPLKQEVCFRRYQSWIDKETLLGDFYKQNIVWNKKELNEFLDQLMDRYCHRKIFNDRVENCFGYVTKTFPLLTFEKGILYGLSLRYFSSEIKPQDCIKNLAEILNFSPNFFKNIEELNFDKFI